MFGSRSAGLDPMRTVGLQDLQARQQQELARMQEEHKRQLLEAEGATKRQKRGRSKQAPPLMPEPEPLPPTPTVVYRTPLPLAVPVPTPLSSPAPLQSSSRSSRSSKVKAKQKKRITSEEEEEEDSQGTGDEEEEEVPKEVGEVSMGVPKKNGGKPRQPLNAFMLFRMQEAPLLKKENPKLTLAETNKRISAAWNELQDHVRDTYLRKAKEGQLEYAKAKLAYGRQLYCCAGLAAAFPEGGKYKSEAKARKSEELGIEWSQKSTEDQEKWIKNHKRREKKNKEMAL